MRNKIIFGVLMVLVVVSVLGIIRAEMLVSDAGVEYDDEILEELNNSNWVAVLIDLKDISEMDNVFSNFSVNEIRDLYKSPYSSRIDAEITEEGFEKLINDSRVTEIYFNAPVSGGDNGSGRRNRKKYYWLFLLMIIPLAIILYIIIRRNKNK